MKNLIDEIIIQKELGLKRIFKIMFIIIVIVSLCVIVFFYFYKQSFRKWVDINIFRKNVTNESINSIYLNTDKNNQIYCYSKNICILNDKVLTLYNSFGESITELSVDINYAIFDSKDKYLAIAEKNGQNVCLIFDKDIMWKQKIDGQIEKISINRNGYLAIIATDNTYKSIIIVFDSNGKQILKNYLSASRVTDVSISNDNKKVAYCELDTSGTLLQSKIEILSIEKANNDSEDIKVSSYQADLSKMIVSIEYQDKENLVCIYDDSVYVINQNESKQLLQIDNAITFISGDLNKAIAYISELSNGMLGQESILNSINPSNKQTIKYNLEENPKDLYTFDSLIGVNTGTDIYFINTLGLLVKIYSSNQEISNVLLSNNLALVIYKDRIEIIEL